MQGGDKHHVELMNSDQPISYDGIDYSVWVRSCANWSTTNKHSDWNTDYTVLDYTKYADMFDRFVEKYPYFTIVTDGCAESESTFGNPGAGKFGIKRFPTHNFDDRRENKYLVDSYMNDAFFGVWAKIGVGFQRKDGKLYVFPFYDVGIYSAGAYTRCLDYGLIVRTITFHPTEDNEIVINIDHSVMISSANTSEAALYSYDVQKKR